MRVIYKYPLTNQNSLIPFDVSSKILKVMLQGDIPQLWIEHEQGIEFKNKIMVHVIETGKHFDKFNNSMVYIDSFQVPLRGFNYVGHVYYRPETKDWD